MLNLDEAALESRFWDTELSWTDSDGQKVVLADEQRLVENQPKENVDETQPWVRFTISPGDSQQETLELIPAYTQLGMAYLQVFAPKGTGMGAAREIRDQFVAAYRGWKSDDEYTFVDGVGFKNVDQPAYAQINVSVSWQSMRRPS